MKVILIIGDGMADRPLKELHEKTPLQAANKPTMDRIACLGICGMMDPIAPGIPPGSDTSHLAIFGYDPYRTCNGRGAFEAIGVGLRLQPGDVAFRCNLATVDEDMVIIDRRAGRIHVEGDTLAKTLDGIKLKGYPDLKVIFRHSTEHRCVLVLRGPGLSRMVSDSDPHKMGFPVQNVEPLDGSPEAEKTAEILNELSGKFHEVLSSHPLNEKRRLEGKPPANAVLFRGAGMLPSVTPLTTTYRIRAAVIAGNALIRGVSTCVGMDSIIVPGLTGTIDTDIMAQAKATVENLTKYDFIYSHVKGTDNASHDGNIQQKIMMIERMDTMLHYILENISLNNTIIAITADHTTPIVFREHSGDPVPLTIAGPGVRRDSVKEFSEVACATGGLGRIRGMNLIPILMNFIGKTRKFGE